MENRVLSIYEFCHNLEFQNRKGLFKCFQGSLSFQYMWVSAKLLPSKTWKSSPHSVLSLFEVVPRSPKYLRFLLIMSVWLMENSSIIKQP